MLGGNQEVGFRAVVGALLSLSFVASQMTDFTKVNVGDPVCFEGFVMDNFCIERGTLLDEPRTTTLLNPERHSVHCLIDVFPCYTSNYELLAAPTGGDSMYSRAFQLTDDGKAGIIELAAAVGDPDPDDAFRCSECTGTMGSLGRGFRALVYGIVTAEAQPDGTPATIHVVDADATHDQQGTTFCTGTFPTEQNLAFGDPMVFPSILAPTEAPIPSPTNGPTNKPTAVPTASPTMAPVVAPTPSPITAAPVVTPTESPTTAAPVVAPTELPTTAAPVAAPILPPTGAPVTIPTDAPVDTPTESLVAAPTESPSTGAPIVAPTDVPASTPVAMLPLEATAVPSAALTPLDPTATSPSAPPMSTVTEDGPSSNDVSPGGDSEDSEAATSSSSRKSWSFLMVSASICAVIHWL